MENLQQQLPEAMLVSRTIPDGQHLIVLPAESAC